MFNVGLTLLAVYVACVRIFRYRRIRAIEMEYTSAWRDGAGSLTPVQAQKITQASILFESPLMMRIGIQVALFKSYGIPTVSALLLKTGQFKTPDSISKRVADTATLIATWISCPLAGPGSGDDSTRVDDPRSSIAVSRVNFLHNKYNISNDDYLYNLALFIREPIEWTARYDWRAPTDLERTAMFVFWQEIGRRMGIRDIWKTYEDMLQWAMEYETTQMVPSTSAHLVGDTTFEFFLRRLPDVLGIRNATKQVAICLLDQRLRNAMGFQAPPAFLQACVYGFLHMRGLFIRYLCMPRRKPSLYVTLDNPSLVSPNHDPPRMHAVYRRPHPWYWPESTGLRKTLENFQVKIGLRDPNRLPGPRFKSEGYRLEELRCVILGTFQV